MPTICVFKGITIKMYYREKEHNSPHIHAFYNDESAAFLLSTGEIYEGYFPQKEKQYVKDFIIKHKKELLEMWLTETYMKIEEAN